MGIVPSHLTCAIKIDFTNYDSDDAIYCSPLIDFLHHTTANLFKYRTQNIKIEYCFLFALLALSCIRLYGVVLHFLVNKLPRRASHIPFSSLLVHGYPSVNSGSMSILLEPTLLYSDLCNPLSLILI